MKIIIGAMEAELMPLIKQLQAKKNPSSIIDEYFVKESNLLIAFMGIGPVNAAVGLSYLLAKYQTEEIEFILNIGTCGALNPNFKIGDVFFIEKALYLTANASGFGYDYGQIPRMPKFYQSDEKLLKSIEEKLTAWNPKRCNLATSDIFIDSQKMANLYLENIKIKIDIVEMESAAFFQTAYNFKIPFVGIKIISDVIGQTKSNESQFEENLAKSAQEISKIVTKLI